MLIPQGLLRHLVMACCLLTLLSCAADEQDVADASPSTVPQQAAPPVEAESVEPTPVLPYAGTDFHTDVLVAGAEKHWLGDFDEMVARRTIRVLVVYSRTSYFLDGVVQRGIAYDAMQAFEDFVNQRLGNKNIKLHVIYIPVATDELIPALQAGVGDIAVANFTVTEARRQQVDFTRPVLRNVSELLVTGPSAKAIEQLSDLSGREIHVRRSSSYHDSLLTINRQLAAQGKAPARIITVNPFLEDADLLELVDTGLLPMTVVDDHIAEVWDRMYENIQVHRDLVINDGREIAWAFRRNSPLLESQLNEFLRTHGKGTLFGNVIFKRYYESGRFVRNPLSAQDMPKLQETVALFQKYAEIYGFDWTMIASMAYQESHLDQGKRSHAGAVGIMQVLPSTAADSKVNVADIHQVENNIHAGIKYLRFLSDHYFSDTAIDDFNRLMFSFAAYNAGPNKVNRLRREAQSAGYNPNIWFNNVEIIAASRVGNETVQYVSNIFKYWLTYKLLRARDLIDESPAESGYASTKN